MVLIHRLVVVLAASFGLASCLTSEGLLLTAKNARSAPFANGDYDACQFETDSSAPDCKTMRFARDASGLYTLTLVDEDEKTFARFKRVQRGAYAAQLWGENDDNPFYFLATAQGDKRVLSMIQCEDLPAAFRDKHVALGSLAVEDGASTCVARTPAFVAAAARAWLATGKHQTGARIVYAPKT